MKSRIHRYLTRQRGRPPRQIKPLPPYTFLLWIGPDQKIELDKSESKAYAGELMTGELGVVDCGFSFIESPLLRV